MSKQQNRARRLGGIGAVLIAVLMIAGCASSSGGGGDSGDDAAPGCGDQASCTQATTTIMGATFAGLGAAVAGSTGNVVNEPSLGVCANAGNVSVGGSYSGMTDPYTFSLTLIFSNCQFGTFPNEVILSGTFDISAIAYLASGNGQYTMSSTNLTGSGHYNSQAYAFDCDMSMVLNINDPTFSYSATICGENVSYSP